MQSWTACSFSSQRLSGKLQDWDYGNTTGDKDAKYRREFDVPMDGSYLVMKCPDKFMQPWAEADGAPAFDNTDTPSARKGSCTQDSARLL